MSNKISSSFRDPSGVVYWQNGKLLRQINLIYKEDYDLLISSGLYKKLVKKNYLVAHTEVEDTPLIPEFSYKIIQPEIINFISYPYEWSFTQLKDAALLTLAIQKEAFKAGMTLKDASAYNIQFHRSVPVLLDTLSFTKYIEGEPWVAYKQFCQHFLAPLALMSKTDIRLGKLLMNHIDGIPLDLCSKLLPRSSRFNFGLATHIHIHSQAEQRYNTTEETNNSTKTEQKHIVSKNGFIGLIDNLEKTVESLSLKTTGKEWANYYSQTNYSDDAFNAKRNIIKELVSELHPDTVLDLGANTGVFSREAALDENCFVISSDIDPEAVEINYLQLKKEKQNNILPLIIDLTNPSPAIGWDNTERDSFYQRGKSDVVLALALIHHLAISNNVPLVDIAHTFARLGKYLILEFVPKEDSQVKRLLRTRDDIFYEYNQEGLLQAFLSIFTLEKQIPVPGSARTIFLFKVK